MSKQNLSVALAIKNNNFYAESEEEFIMLFLRNLFKMFVDSKGKEGLSPFDESLIKLIQTNDFNSLTELEKEKFKDIFFKVSRKGFELGFDVGLEGFDCKFENRLYVLFENFKKIFSTEGKIEVLKETFKDEESFQKYVKSNIELRKMKEVICLIEVPNEEMLMEKLQKTGSTYQINFKTIEDEGNFSSNSTINSIDLMFLG